MRHAHLTVLALSLALCSCGNPATKPDVAGSPRTDIRQPNPRLPEARRRLAEERYTRPGRWRAVEATDAYAAIDRSEQGDRLVILRKGSGYDVYRMSLGCARQGAFSIGDGRGSARDDVAPDSRSPAPRYLDLSAQARRICSSPASGEITGLAVAIRELRTRAVRDAGTADAPRPNMTQADRDAAIAAMKAYRERK